MKKYVVCAVISLCTVVKGMDGVEMLKRYGSIDSVTVTSTNLSIKFKSAGLVVPDRPMRGMARRSADYAEKNEALVLTPDEETMLIQRHASITFTPVSFKSQHKGFRILQRIDHRSFGHEVRTNAMYLALSDTPVEVGEDDVEMILETERNSAGYTTDKVEWKKFEREGGAQPSPPSREPAQPAAVETPPEQPAVVPPEPVEAQAPVIEDRMPDIADGEDGQSEEKSKTNTLWLYALIPLVLSAAALYFIRRRPKI